MLKLSSLVIIILIFSNLPVGQAQVILQPDSLSISGSVSDNYMNMTYNFLYSSQSDHDIDFTLDFVLPSGVYLSNLTVVSDNVTYYGHVKIIEEAQQDYQDAVDQNKSAVLIEHKSRDPDEYVLSANIKAGKTLNIVIQVEGFILREQGEYHVRFVEFPSLVEVTLDIDIDFISTLSEYKSPKLFGFDQVSVTPLGTGYNIQFHSDNQEYTSNYEFSYLMENDLKSHLIGYDNGNEQFFVYQIAPEIYTTEKQLPKEYIFVIDKSASMGNNERISKAKVAFSNIIKTLNEGDRFNVISFETSIDKLWSEGTRSANSSNIDIAVSWVNDISEGGGTNINDAITSALKQLNNENKMVKAITILSDGKATAGEFTSTSSIRSNVKTENNIDAQIFSIGLGDGSDAELMGSLAYDSDGNYVLISDQDDVIAKLEGFYAGFSSPVSLGLDLVFDTGYDIAPSLEQVNNPIYNGSEVLISGKFNGSLKAETIVRYFTFNNTYSNEIIAPTSENTHVERIWALNKINRLLDFYIVASGTEIDQQVMELALDYGLVISGFTAMVLVIDDEASQTDANELDQGIQDPPVADVQNTDPSSVNFPLFSLVSVLLIMVLNFRRRLK